MRETIKLGLILLVFSLVSAGVLGFVNSITDPIITEREAEEARLAELYGEEEELAPGHFRVTAPRPISAAGGKTVSGRKAIAEARRDQEERWEKQAKKRNKK